jgi:hypothetical protein
MVKQGGENWFKSAQNLVKNHLKSIELGWVSVVFSDSLQFSMIPSHIQRLFVCSNSDNSPNSHFSFTPLRLKQGENPSMGVGIDVTPTPMHWSPSAVLEASLILKIF